MLDIREHGLSRKSPKLTPPPERPTYSEGVTGNGLVYQARLEPDGSRFEAPAGLPLLQAAELAGLDAAVIASSCRNGTCRTCICLLLEGSVSYRIEWPGLSADEKNEGYILPCVAYPASDVVLQMPI